MLSLCGVSAWIEVDGKVLEEYGVEEDYNQSRVTCWIGTQANKDFSVVFKDDEVYREHSLASSLQLDGSSIPGKVLRPSPGVFGPGPPILGGARTVVQNGQVLSATSSRPFVFSKLELTDEDEYLNQSSMHLGEIRISIYRVQPLASRLFESGSSVSSHGKVHERSKKAVTHCVSYGQEVKTTTQYSCSVRYLDGHIPLATFVFKYRDIGLLQANGIIPMPPAKKKVAVSEDVLDLTLDDDSNIKREGINKKMEIVDAVAQKRTASLVSKRTDPDRQNDVRPAKKIKREKKSVDSGEVIDLT